MKIKYEFVTGEFVEIEVKDEELGKIIIELNKREESSSRYQRMMEVLFDTQMDYSNWGSCEMFDEDEEEAMKIEAAILELNEKQQDFIDCVYGPKCMTQKAYAEKEGVSPTAINKRKKAIKNKLKKFSKQG